MKAPSEIRVSVIIATYNYAQFIAETLQSVEAQTMREWECVIIDDASTDTTEEIVRTFTDRDPRFRYIKQDQNKGVSETRNTGFATVVGEYIQLLDADDVIAPQKLERHVAYLDTHANTDVVYSDFKRFTGTVDLEPPGVLAPYEKHSGVGGALVTQLISGNIFRLNTILFRKRILSTMHGFRSEFLYIEDWEFWLRIAMNGYEFHFLDDPHCMAGVRVAHASLSNDRPAMRKFHLPVRQTTFVNGQLTIWQRVGLLLRYCDFFLEMLILRREPIVFTTDGKWWFMPLAIISALIVFPFWIVSRLVIRPLRS